MNNNVFDYVIDSLNKTLNNGIEYYKDDKEKKERLVDIYNYINNQQEEYVQVEVVPEDDFKTDKNEEVAKEIKGLIKSFVNKQTNISASALNLENKLKKSKKVTVPEHDNDEEELQVEQVESKVPEDDIESQNIDDIPQSLKRETSDITESEDFSIVKKLVSDEKDYEQYHKDDNNDVSFDTTFDFDDIVTEIKEKTGEPVEVEPLEEEELVIEKPRKRSILDIFKKN